MGKHPSHEQGWAWHSPAMDSTFWAAAARAWAGAGARSARARLSCAPTLARAELPAAYTSTHGQSPQYDRDTADRTHAATFPCKWAASCEPHSLLIDDHHVGIYALNEGFLSTRCRMILGVDTLSHACRQARVSPCSSVPLCRTVLASTPLRNQWCVFKPHNDHRSCTVI